MKKALILDGKVADVADNTFPVHPALIWVNCPDNTKPGDLYDGDTFTSPPPPPEPPVGEIEALKLALVKKGVISESEINAEKVKK